MWKRLLQACERAKRLGWEFYSSAPTGESGRGVGLLLILAQRKGGIPEMLKIE